MIASMGSSTMRPQTPVLNPRGEPVYNKVGSVTYETLRELVELAGSESAED